MPRLWDTLLLQPSPCTPSTHPAQTYAFILHPAVPTLAGEEVRGPHTHPRAGEKQDVQVK